MFSRRILFVINLWISFAIVRAQGPLLVPRLLSPPDGVTNVRPQTELTWAYGTNWLRNGNFEAQAFGPQFWTQQSVSFSEWLVDANSYVEGRRSVRVAFPGAPQKVALWQDLVLPASGPDLVLTWAERIRNRADRPSSTSGETWRVSLRTTAGVELARLREVVYRDGVVASDWSRQAVSLNAWRGQTVRITFEAQSGTNRNAVLEAHLDDVTVIEVPPADVAFDVYLGPRNNLPAESRLGRTNSTRWPLANLSLGTTNYWRVVAVRGAATNSSAIARFVVNPEPFKRFELELPPGPHVAGIAYPATIRALDAAGVPLPHFAGAASMDVFADEVTHPEVLLTLLRAGVVELRNVTSRELDVSGWEIDFHALRVRRPDHRVFIPPGVHLAPAQGVRIETRPISEREVEPSLDLVVVESDLEFIPIRPQALVLRNALGVAVDVVPLDGYDLASIEELAPVSPDLWRGAGLTWQVGGGILLRSGRLATRSAAAWERSFTIPPPPASLPKVGYGRVPVAASPALVFAGGIWRGSLRLDVAATNTSLRLSLQSPAYSVAETLPLGAIQTAPYIVIRATTGPIAENASPRTGGLGLRLETPTSSEPTMVRLRTEPPGALRFPAQVVIPAGATELALDLAPIDDARIQGDRVVRVTAEADGYASTFVEVPVQDDDVPALTLEMPRNMAEGDSTEAVLRIAPPAEFATTVRFRTLEPLDFPELGGGRLIERELAPGTTEVRLPVRAVNEGLLGGPSKSFLSAEVGSWPPVRRDVDVEDRTRLSLTAELFGTPGNGDVSLRVAFYGAYGTDVVLRLHSNDAAVAAIPPEFQVGAGTVAVYIPLTLAPTETTTRTRRTTLTVEAPGLSSVAVPLEMPATVASRVAVVVDPGPLAAGSPLSFRAKAYDDSGREMLVPGFPPLTGQLVDAAGKPLEVISSSPGSLVPAGPASGARIRMEVLGTVGESDPFDVAPANPLVPLPFAATDLRYSNAKGRLWAVVSSASPIEAGRLVAVDPATSQILARINPPTGHNFENGSVLPTPDGEDLLALLDDRTQVALLSATDGSVRWMEAAGSDGPEGHGYVYELVECAQNPWRAVIIRLVRRPSGEIDAVETWLAKPDGVVRATGARLALAAPGVGGEFVARPYGPDAPFGVVGAKLRADDRVDIPANSTNDPTLGGRMLGGVSTVVANGRVLLDDGTIRDVRTAETLAQFGEFGPCFFAAEGKLAGFVRGIDGGSVTCRMLDSTTGRSTGLLNWSTPYAPTARLTVAGPGRIAWIAGTTLVLADVSAVVDPAGADGLSLEIATDPPTGQLGQDLQWIFTLHNRRATTVTNAEMDARFTAGLTLASIPGATQLLGVPRFVGRAHTIAPGSSNRWIVVTHAKVSGPVRVHADVSCRRGSGIFSTFADFETTVRPQYTPDVPVSFDVAPPYAWDAARQRLYFVRERTLRALNLETGGAEAVRSLDREFEVLTLDAGARFLYGLAANRGAIHQIDLEPPHAVRILEAGAGRTFNAFLPLPTHPGWVVAVRYSTIDRPADVALFENGVRKPGVFTLPPDGLGFEGLTAHPDGESVVVHASNHYGWIRFGVIPEGLRWLGEISARTPTPGISLPGFGAVRMGRMFLDARNPVPERGMPIDGNLGGWDPALGWIVQLDAFFGGPGLATIANEFSGAPLETHSFATTASQLSGVIPLGSGRIGFSAGLRFNVLTADWLRPAPTADLQMSLRVLRNDGFLKGTAEVEATLRNAGPNVARQVQIVVPSTGGQLLTEKFLSRNGGPESPVGPYLKTEVGDLAVNEVVRVRLQLQLETQGTSEVWIAGVSTAADPNRANQLAHVELPVALTPDLEVRGPVSLGATSLVHRRVDGRLYLGAPRRIRVVDPVTGAEDSPIPLEATAENLALSSDEAWLYAALPSEGTVVRIRLGDRSVELVKDASGAPLPPICAFALVPGDPKAVILSSQVANETFLLRGDGTRAPAALAFPSRIFVSSNGRTGIAHRNACFDAPCGGGTEWLEIRPDGLHTDGFFNAFGCDWTETDREWVVHGLVAYHPTSHRSRVLSVRESASGGPTAWDREGRRLWRANGTLRPDGRAESVSESLDPAGLVPQTSWKLPGVGPEALVAWNDGNLAFLDRGDLYVLPAQRHLEPRVVLSLENGTRPLTLLQTNGGLSTVRLVNRGTAPARSIAIAFAPGDGLKVNGVRSSAGWAQLLARGSGRGIWKLTELAPGASAELTFYLTGERLGETGVQLGLTAANAPDAALSSVVRVVDSIDTPADFDLSAGWTSGGNLRLTFPTESSRRYQVERSESLTEPVWIGVGAEVVGNGQERAVEFPITQPGGFFRVLVR